MQALNCTTQQVSKEKMGSCSPAKAPSIMSRAESLNELNLPKDLLMFAKRKSIDLTYAMLLHMATCIIFHFNNRH